MRYRTFGRLGWPVSEVGYGMWGMAGWTGSEDEQSRAALREAVALGCNFFDTAWAYGDGRSERLLGELVREHPEAEGKLAEGRLYTASKIPPKNRKWPPVKGSTIDEVFPPDYMREYTERTLKNLGRPKVDLMQLHVWEDDWARDERWQRVVDDLKREGMIGGFGISVNRWEPANVAEALRTGLVDAVQVIYNIFDQAPEDELFPLCRELEVAVIARVPFDEGSLTGTLTEQSTWPKGDWRGMYFGPENLRESVRRADALKPLVPSGSTLPEMALRFILSNPDVSTVIPGMRQTRNVRANMAASDRGPLDATLLERLREHRWDRMPAAWSA
ncbi:MAG TPA: aldo/keto reductase [Gemmatimonadaceae bacterium]|nr:aldo/keto reductase [Gemmatimonadaceae bacterium]